MGVFRPVDIERLISRWWVGEMFEVDTIVVNGQHFVWAALQRVSWGWRVVRRPIDEHTLTHREVSVGSRICSCTRVKSFSMNLMDNAADVLLETHCSVDEIR